MDRWRPFTLRSMTPVYPSSVDAGALFGFSVDGTGGPSKRRDDDDEEEDAGDEGDPSPELLLYTNMKLATTVTRTMPLTPWHWRDTPERKKSSERP